VGNICGAWLLVAGPLYQGAVELDELDVDREAIEGIKASAIRTAPGRAVAVVVASAAGHVRAAPPLDQVVPAGHVRAVELGSARAVDQLL
jgi:hypothetical protein